MSIKDIEKDILACNSRMDLIYNYIESYINTRKDETDQLKSMDIDNTWVSVFLNGININTDRIN